MAEKGQWRWDDKKKDFLIVRESADGFWEHLEPVDVNRLETERAELMAALGAIIDSNGANYEGGWKPAKDLLARLGSGDGVKS